MGAKTLAMITAMTFNEPRHSIDVSVVLPCRNEEESIGDCLQQIQNVFAKHNVKGEIIVSDSSTDNSTSIAFAAGACVVKHDTSGYGNAYLAGFKHARGRYIFGADPDGSYDFSEIPRFMEALRQGSDLVIGNRLKGTIKPNAMPWLHRYIGTPLLTQLVRIFFGIRLGDSQCGMRAWRTEALNELELTASGMEFASEMIVQAAKQKMRISELPIDYANRLGQSKLRTWRDGWRHLELILKIRFGRI